MQEPQWEDIDEQQLADRELRRVLDIGIPFYAVVAPPVADRWLAGFAWGHWPRVTLGHRLSGSGAKVVVTLLTRESQPTPEETRSFIAHRLVGFLQPSRLIEHDESLADFFEVRRSQTAREATALLRDATAWREALLVIDDAPTPAVVARLGTSWGAKSAADGRVLFVEATGIEIAELRLQRLPDPESDLPAYIHGMLSEALRRDAETK